MEVNGTAVFNFRVIVICVCILLPAGSVFGQDYYARGKESWMQGNYALAINDLKHHRNSAYNRKPEVDYMLGTSGCRVANMSRWGASVLHWLSYAYPLTDEARRLVIEQHGLCVRNVRQVTPPTLAGNTAWIPAGMKAKGKTYYWIDKEIPVATYPARRLRDIPLETFSQRLVPIGQLQTVLRAEEDFRQFRFEVSKWFIVATSGNHSSANVARIGSVLDTYLEFFISEYQMVTPSYYLTVYLVPTINELRAFAGNAHGLDISPATIGYSFQDDLSMAGVIPGMAVGTMIHELFHLSVRSNFGDIPPWLDEGIASLYEVTSLENNRVRGIPNWRGPVLVKLWSYRPSLAEIIQADWSRFKELQNEYHDPEYAKRQAAYFAMNRNFVLYLQEIGRLAPIFMAFKDHNPNNYDDAREYAIRIVERILDGPLEMIQNNFESWFDTEIRTGNFNAGGRIMRKSLPRSK